METRRRDTTHSGSCRAVLKSREDLAEGWMSSPESFVVDGIVTWLKNHPAPRFCWHRTAPSLRLLNKHWRREMDKHITDIGEHSSFSLDLVPPELQEEAIKSLLKFPNLKSLNLSGFAPHEKCKLLIATVKKIPTLDRLTVNQELLDSIETDDLDGLVCKTVCTREWGYFPGSLELLKLSTIRMERFIMDFFAAENPWITEFLTAVPSVKRLAAPFASFENGFEALRSLEELELGYEGENVQGLAALTSIASLRLGCDINIDSLQLLVPLKKLEVLIVNVDQNFAFDRSFGDVIGRLKKLNIGLSSTRHKELPREFWKAVAGLEELMMSHGFVIHTGDLIRHRLRRLRDLSITLCRLHGESIPWNRLTTLTSLNLSHISGNDEVSNIGLMDLSPLRHLRQLHMNLNENDSTLQLLQSIKQLTNLEDLRIFNVMGHNVRHHDVIMALEKLPHLMDTRNEVAGLFCSGVPSQKRDDRLTTPGELKKASQLQGENKTLQCLLDGKLSLLTASIALLSQYHVHCISQERPRSSGKQRS